MICPHCGAELKEGASFCRQCGSDENTGWKEGAEFYDEELPDYEEILENELGIDSRGNKTRKANPVMIAAAVLLILSLLAAYAL